MARGFKIAITFKTAYSNSFASDIIVRSGRLDIMSCRKSSNALFDLRTRLAWIFRNQHCKINDAFCSVTCTFSFCFLRDNLLAKRHRYAC